MSVQSVPHLALHNTSSEDERPRSRALSIEDLHRSPSRAKTIELTRSRQDLSFAKFVSGSQTRRGPQSELAAASSASPGPRRRARSREDLRRPALSAQPPAPVPRPRSRVAVVKHEEDGRDSPVTASVINQHQIHKEEFERRQKENDLISKMNQLEVEKKELLYQNFKATDVIKDLEDKIVNLDKIYKAERDAPRDEQNGKVEKLLESNKILQTTVSKIQSKYDKLEVENEELKVSFAVMKAEKHNAISALETFKVKQQNATDEMGHLYKLNSEQAVRITEFEKEKKLNAEEFAHLYKIKKEQATRIKDLEKEEKDLTQFHKTISDQAVKISEMESQLDKTQKDLSDSKLDREKKATLLEKELIDKAAETERLKKLVSEMKKINDDLQASTNVIKEQQSKDTSDLRARITLLEKENEQLKKTTSEQSVKIVDLENVKNEKKEHLQAQPKKDLLKDINKLKEHYLETIDNWKSKYEESKMLLNLRDQELLIYKRRGEKKIIEDDKGTCGEIDTDGKQKAGVDTVDDDEK